jgi:hypothetical protein
MTWTQYLQPESSGAAAIPIEVSRYRGKLAAENVGAVAGAVHPIIRHRTRCLKAPVKVLTRCSMAESGAPDSVDGALPISAGVREARAALPELIGEM